MSQEFITIRGARENNLKNVSLRIPKRKITIFTGVSGSGKSSIVFDTIAAEARRQLNETFSTFVRNFLPRYAQPEADAIENLSMAIVVDQKHLGGGSHSTVGTITDIYSVLRLLFSRAGKPFVGYANAFSFNDPQGMCPECNGLGRKIGVDLDKFLDTTKSLNEGAILYPDYAVDSWGWNILIQSELFDPDKRLADYSAEEMDLLLHSKPYKVKMQMAKAVNLTFEGIVDKFSRKYITGDVKSYSERTQASVAPYMTYGPCTLCRGARLSQAALGCRIDGYNIADLAAMEVDELIEVIRAIKDPVAAPMVAALVERLQHMIDIGLEYLSLNRETDTLSGGESQRIKMVKHLGSSLVDVLYVFDEPSIGMHPRDVHRLNELLQKLRDKGNSVIVVEHDPDVIKVADHVVDVGPYAGTRRWDHRLRGQLRGAAGGRYPDGAPPAAGDADQVQFSGGQGQAVHRQRPGQQPAERQRRHSDRRADRGHRCRRVRQEFAHPPELSAAVPGCDRDRPGAGRDFQPVESGHLHGDHGRGAQDLCQGEQGQPVVVQL